MDSVKSYAQTVAAQSARVFRLYVGHNIGSAEMNPTRVSDTVSEVLLGHGFLGWTELSARGAWRGIREKTTVVEIFSDSSESDHVRSMAKVLAHRLQQEAVGLVETAPYAEVEFVVA